MLLLVGVELFGRCVMLALAVMMVMLLTSISSGADAKASA